MPPGEGIKGYPREWKIMGDQSGDAYSLVEISLAEPHKDWLPSHVHKREDEAWYVIEGELSFKVGDQTATAGPGTYVFAPRYIPHTYKVVKAPARYLLILSPSGAEYLFSKVEELRKKFRDSTGNFFPDPAYFEELKNISTTYHNRGPVGNQKPFTSSSQKNIEASEAPITL